MERMFLNCNNLKSINLSHSDISSVININKIISTVYSGLSIDLSYLDASSLTGISNFFMDNLLYYVNLSHANISSVTIISNLLILSDTLESIDLSYLDASSELV
jgi:surface protein